MVSAKHCIVIGLLTALLVLCSAEYEDSFADMQEINEPLDSEYDLVARGLEEEYEEPGNFADDDEYIDDIEAQSFSKREPTGFNWYETTLKNIPKIVVNYKVKAERTFGPVSRSFKDGTNESHSVIEKDTFIIDIDENAVLDAIESKNGKELTVLDYSQGVMAVLTPSDKMCRLHEIPEEARNINLAEQKEELESLSKSGKIVEVTENEDDTVDYRQSSKAVNDKEIGAKIVQICKTKKYKMVWMESFDTGSEKRQLSEDQFNEEPSVDFLDEDLPLEGEVDKRGCRVLKVWHCAKACTTTYKRTSYCCKRDCLPNSTCIRTCYKNVRDKFCCGKKCVYYYKRQSYCCKKGCTPNKGRCIKRCYKKVPIKTCRQCCGWYSKKCCNCGSEKNEQ